MALNTEAFYAGKATYADIVRAITHADLYKLTDDFFTSLQASIAGVTDGGATFVPHDPALKEGAEEAYTLGHVIVHLTASLEENASVSSVLARGITFDGRLRNEVPWQTIRTAQQVHGRINESRRMCRAFLDTWPDAPHLDITVVRIPHFGPMNAVGMHVLGILHGESHSEQLQEIMRQSKTLL